MTRVIGALAVVAAFGLMVAGCGSSGTKTVTEKVVTVTASSNSSSTAAVTTSTASATLSTSSVTTSATSSAAASVNTVHLSTFESPSRNIGCVVLDGTARCDINHRNWSPPARPASCPKEVDFGQGLEVSRSGPGRFVCAGDTAMDPSAPELAYGSESVVGPFKCVSATTGMTCTNTTTGHGFLISIQSNSLF